MLIVQTPASANATGGTLTRFVTGYLMKRHRCSGRQSCRMIHVLPCGRKVVTSSKDGIELTAKDHTDALRLLH